MPFLRSSPRFALSGCLALLALALAALSPPLRAAETLPYRTDAVLVAFRDAAPLRSRLQSAARFGLEPDPAFRSPYLARLRIAEGARGAAAPANVKALLAALRRDPAVRLAEPDYLLRVDRTPDDPRFRDQWGLKNTGAEGGRPGADIDAARAWRLTTGSGRVVVAVLDTGIDASHPDLAENLLRDDGGRLVGYDFANDDADPDDDHGHGTHVAGTIAARGNNGRGVAGVCWRLRLMPVKFLRADGNGATSDAIRAIDFARERGARVLNASWGGGAHSQLLLEAIQRARDAGILFVAAAGNESEDTDERPHYPSGYNRLSANVLSVAASDDRDGLAGFSNYGVESVDLAAPGVDILSTAPNGGYRYESGTSMAAPHVSGVAALILSRDPKLDALQVKARILGAVDRPDSLAGRTASGRLNAGNALEDDAVPPAAPAALTPTHRGERSLRFTWLAPGDDGMAGRAARYRMWLSDRPIDEETLSAALPAAPLPEPGEPGELQGRTLSGLEPDRDYYVALAAVDNVGNRSPLAAAGPVRTLPSAALCLLEDDVEGEPSFAGDPPWAPAAEAPHGGRLCYSDSPGAPYGANLDASLTSRGPVRLDERPAALSFWARTDLEDGFDLLRVEVSADGGASWQAIRAITGRSEWTFYSLPLLAFRGSDVRIRFRLLTDSAVAGDGAWVDDISVCVSPRETCDLEDTVEGAPRFFGPEPWSVTDERSFSPSRAYTDSPGAPYRSNRKLALALASPIRVTAGAPQLSFWAAHDLEESFDFVRVEESVDGGAHWRLVTALTGASQGSLYTFPLSADLGDRLLVRFRLVTDGTGVADGIWLDDIRVCGERMEPLAGEPPAAPTDLTARPESNRYVDLAWSDNSDDETAFLVERRGSGDWEQIAALPPNSPAYRDRDLPVRGVLRYRVRARSPAGYSSYAGPARADVLPPVRGRLRAARALEFGSVAVGARRTRTLVLRNASERDQLEVRIEVPEGPYRIESGGGTRLLEPGGRHAVRISFRPAAVKEEIRRLRLRSTDPARPGVAVRLSGRGTEPAAFVPPVSRRYHSSGSALGRSGETHAPPP